MDRKYREETVKRGGWFLLTLLLVFCCAAVMRPTSVKAASGLTTLKASKTYKKYDFTGDRKKDSFKYKYKKSSGKATVYLNGKKKGTIFLARGGNIYRWQYSKKRIYLIAEYSQYGGHGIDIYRYKNKKFTRVVKDSAISDTAFVFKSVQKVEDNILYVESFPRSFHVQSFSEAGEPPFQCVTQYEFVDGKLKPVSRIASVIDRTLYTANDEFYTSTTKDLTDIDGPVVPEYETVELKSIYFRKNNPVIYEIEYNGQTGWFEDSEYITLE